VSKAKKQNKSSTFFIAIVVVLSYLVAWSYWANVRPTLVMAGCSDTAYHSSQIVTKDEPKVDYSYGYDHLYAVCLTDNNIY
jgi:hypothetical protein